MKEALIPLWLKIGYTLMAAVIVPAYWRAYGPVNFLWFSDIALLSMAAALWLESRLLASMMAVGVLPMEIAWLADFLAGGKLLGIAAYMFGKGNPPLYLRALSLFHLALPPVILLMLMRHGYDHRALPAQIALALVVMPLAYRFSPAEENINWVFGPAGPQTTIPPLAYLALWLVAVPLFIYVPMHLLLGRVFGGG